MRIFILQLYDWCREQKTNTNLKTIIIPLLHSGIIVITAAPMRYIAMYMAVTLLVLVHQ